jgi:DNA-binding NarL/FixJ family response regulator
MKSPSPSPSLIRLLLADDHYVVRIGLKTVLELEPDLRVVVEAANRKETLARFRQHRPDVALIDLRMPGGGLETLRELRREFLTARLLVLTTSELEEDIHRAMDAGASGYAPKTIVPNELIAAIRTVHAGGRFLPPALAQILNCRSATPELSQREQAVLALLAKGLTNKEIATLLGISVSYAKVHVAHLLEKLAVGDRTEAATAAFQRGLLGNE